MSAFLPRKFLLAGQLYQRLKSLLVAGTNVTLTADDAAQTITVAASGGGGLSDGDKGDITVGGGGTTLTIDNDAVTYAKIQNVSATDKVLGRSTAGAGDIEEIACTAAGRALLDDADAAAQRTTLGLGTAAQSSTGDFAAASHNHAASDINSGTVATARLGSGTANSTTFLRGDQTWAAPSAGAVSATTVEVDIGATPKFSGKFTITDAAISATSKVLCWQHPGPYTNKGALPGADMEPVQVIAVEPASGSAVVKWQTPPMTGSALETQQGRRNAAGATFDRLDNQRWPEVFAPTRIGKVKGNIKFSYVVFS